MRYKSVELFTISSTMTLAKRCSALLAATFCIDNHSPLQRVVATNRCLQKRKASNSGNFASVALLSTTLVKCANPSRDRKSFLELPTRKALLSSPATRAKIITLLPIISAGFPTWRENAISKKFSPSAASFCVAARNLSSRQTPNKRYDTHVPTSGIEKLALSLGSAFTAIFDPRRGDMVAAMGETTPMITSILEHLHNRMARDVSGSELLRRKPRITNETIDRDYLRSLPDGTLGREYMKFLDSLKTSPDARPPVKYIDDENLVYVMQRYRETHDFTHTLLQMKPNMLGEVTVKYFEAIQLGFPMCVSAAVFGSIRLQKNHRRQLLERNLPWVVEQAQRSRFLLALDWENRFEQTIADLQRECSIVPAADQ